jgi:hypothetical protein
MVGNRRNFGIRTLQMHHNHFGGHMIQGLSLFTIIIQIGHRVIRILLRRGA